MFIPLCFRLFLSVRVYACICVILDVKLVLCVLFVEIDRICGHNFLCTEEKEVTIDMVALVSPLTHASWSMDLSQILIR